MNQFNNPPIIDKDKLAGIMDGLVSEFKDLLAQLSPTQKEEAVDQFINLANKLYNEEKPSGFQDGFRQIIQALKIQVSFIKETEKTQ